VTFPRPLREPRDHPRICCMTLPESRWLLGEFEREPWRSELLASLAI